MQTRYIPDPVRFKQMDTQELRDSLIVDNLFLPGEVKLVYTDLDRAIIGAATPASSPLKLAAPEEMRAEFFCKRREVGVLNVGHAGRVEVDGAGYDLDNLDCLYIGRGSKDIQFSSSDPKKPAGFYLLSYPAHTEYPVKKATPDDAQVANLGSKDACNERSLFKYIHPDGIQSCQLVMGYTVVAPGSVWNTMPPHTHERRMEAYLYFGVEDGKVFHFCGDPQETRHLVISDRQVVLSPSWSIHSGAGTRHYAFCWGMGGENQDFSDMDPLTLDDLK